MLVRHPLEKRSFGFVDVGHDSKIIRPLPPALRIVGNLPQTIVVVLVLAILVELIILDLLGAEKERLLELENPFESERLRFVALDTRVNDHIACKSRANLVLSTRAWVGKLGKGGGGEGGAADLFTPITSPVYTAFIDFSRLPRAILCTILTFDTILIYEKGEIERRIRRKA